MMRGAVFTIVGTTLLAFNAQAQAAADSGVRDVQARGRIVMGTDLRTARHQFDLLQDGARISLQAGHDDAADIEAIRSHFNDIAKSFARGDFRAPGFVHDRVVPGTPTMSARRRLITYRVHPLTRGAELWITTDDSTALQAIREFVEFQQADHRSDGKDSSEHRTHHAP